MGNIKQMIKELCPNGVEFCNLGTLIDIYTGKQFNKRDLLEDGPYPCINGGIYPSGYSEHWNESEDTITISQGGASAGYVNWITTKFWAGAHCYVVRSNSKKLDNRYLYFFLKNMEQKLMDSKHGAGIPALNGEKVKKLLIPVPPIAVQSEIVKYLDNFTLHRQRRYRDCYLRKVIF